MSKEKVSRKLNKWGTLLLGAILMGASAGDPFETSKQLEIFAKVLQEVQTQYVDEIPAEKAVGSAIEGMLKKLDPYTVYYPEDQMEDVRLLQTGEYGGIGCTISHLEDGIFLSSIYEDSPSQKTGLRVGDQLMKIGEVSTEGKSVTQISQLLKGTPGTDVHLEVKRFGESQLLSFDLKRAKIVRDAVPFYGMNPNGTGYIYLSSFTDKSAAEVKNALEKLLDNGAKSLILDLRGNGGGLLQQAVKIISLFEANADTLVTTRGRNGKLMDVYNRQGKALAPNLPLAVLIDGNSASASEIVAGALQDLDRAIILGEKSYGKGLVQQIHPLAYGAQMKVTVAKYYIPSGRCIQKVNYDRDSDGNKTRKKDIEVFETKNGREVVDGDGIYPDSTLSLPFYPEIVGAMNEKGLDLIFVSQQPWSENVNASDFIVSEEMWSDFVSFLEKADFKYQSAAEKEVEEIQKYVAELDYLEHSDLEDLLKKIQERKGAVLASNKSEIQDYLADYYVNKRLGEKASLERGLIHDEVVQGAASILNQPDLMDSLLNAKAIR